MRCRVQLITSVQTEVLCAILPLSYEDRVSLSHTPPRIENAQDVKSCPPTSMTLFNIDLILSSSTWFKIACYFSGIYPARKLVSISLLLRNYRT